jgi:hypothetical protein
MRRSAKGRKVTRKGVSKRLKCSRKTFPSKEDKEQKRKQSKGSKKNFTGIKFFKITNCKLRRKIKAFKLENNWSCNINRKWMNKFKENAKNAKTMKCRKELKKKKHSIHINWMKKENKWSKWKKKDWSKNTPQKYSTSSKEDN